jgi:hypothetical protein
MAAGMTFAYYADKEYYEHAKGIVEEICGSCG